MMQGHRCWCQLKAHMRLPVSQIVTLDVYPIVFEILAFKSRKWLVFSPFHCLTPRSGDSLEFLDKTYPAKTRGMRLRCGETFIILTSTVFD